MEQWQKRTLAWILAQGDMNAALQRISMQPGELFARLPYRGLEREVYQGMMLANLAGREQILDEGDDGDGVRFDARAKPAWLKQPFKQAVDYFRAKVAIPAETYQQLTADFHDWAFVVARMAQAASTNAVGCPTQPLASSCFCCCWLPSSSSIACSPLPQGFTCLMQVSTRSADYVVDTLALRSALGPALAQVRGCCCSG
jgi:hypothetical protein